MSVKSTFGRASRAGLLAAILLLCSVPVAGASDGLFVDRGSEGGACSDGRSVDQVSSVSPWCSLEKGVAAAPAGSTVWVRGGDYPRLVVEGQRRSSLVTVKPVAGESVSVAGLTIDESSFWRFEGFRLTDYTNVEGGSRHLQFVRNEVAPAGPTFAFDLRGDDEHGDTEHVLFEGNFIHDVLDGGGSIDGYAIRAISDVGSFTIRNNRLTRIQGDAIQVSGVENLAIEGNEISEVRKRPGSSQHSDPLQLMKPSGASARIVGNYLHDNAHSILIHDGQRGLVLENNVVVRTDNYGVKVYGAPGLRLVNNTVWDNAYGGVRLDVNPSNSAAGEALPMTGVVAVNNVLQSFSGGSFAVQDHNLIASGTRLGPHDVATAPRFEGNYELAAGSAGIDAGTAAHGAPATDRLGRTRKGVPDMGALERGGGTGAPTPGPAAQTQPGDHRGQGPSGRRKKSLRIKVRGRRTVRAVAARGVRLRVSCPAACRLRAVVRVRGRKLGVTRKRAKAGHVRLKVRLSRRAVKRLRRASRTPLTVRVTARIDGRRLTARRTFKVRR